MRLVHEPAGDDPGGTAASEPRTLATQVETAESVLARMRGLTFRRSIPEDYALVFHFGATARRGLHMLFVPFDLDAVWLVDGEVTRVATLPAWRGFARGRADTVVELPAGAADDVAVGDEVAIAHGDGPD